MAKISVFGVGSLGSQAATILTRMGQDIVALIDKDIVEKKNLTKAAYGLSDVGKIKVEALRDRLLDINGSLQIKIFTKNTQELQEEEFKDIFDVSSIILHTADSKESMGTLVKNITKYYKETGKDIYLVTMYCFDNAAAGLTGLWTPSRNKDMFCPCCLLTQMLAVSSADARTTDNDAANEYSMDRLIGFNVRGLLPDVLFGLSLTTSLIQSIAAHIEGVYKTGRDNLVTKFLHTKEKKNNQIWSPFRDPCLKWQSIETMCSYTGLTVSDDIECLSCGRNIPENRVSYFTTSPQ